MMRWQGHAHWSRKWTEARSIRSSRQLRTCLTGSATIAGEFVGYEIHGANVDRAIGNVEWSG